MTPILHLATDAPAVAAAFAQQFARWAAGNKAFTVALSGGSTPKLLFQHWAEHYAEQINWSQIQLFWGDERCVPPDDEESNFGMTKSMLLDRVDIPPTNVHRIRGENDPAAEALRYGDLLRKHLPQRDGVPVFDLVILGLGDDGHTASIFPDQMPLLDDPGPCAVAIHPESGRKRVTLTGPVINHAQLIVFLVTGEHKAEKVRRVLDAPHENQGLPAAHIRPTGGEVHWFIDEAARG